MTKILIFFLLFFLTKQSEYETDLFWNLLESNSSKNIFYSPFSLELAMAMAYEGSESNTKKQISEAFDFNLNKTVQRKYIDNLLDSIKQSQNKMREEEKDDIKQIQKYQPSTDTSTIENSYFYLRTANSLWPDLTFKINQTYTSSIQKYYDGEVNQLDYQDTENSRKKINSWVEKKTEEKIKNLLAKGTINKATKLVIVNALYFKAAWQNEFEVSQTTVEKFYLENGEVQQVKMMKQSGEYFKYHESKTLKMIELPFKKNQASFYIVMPSVESMKLQELKSSFDQNTFITLQKQMKSTYIKNLWLPKFKIETSMSLAQQLKQLGVIDAFNAEKANFSSISHEEIFITNVIQKTYIDVEESGVEAAAATALTFETTSIPYGEQKFIVNRPFIFCIQFNQKKANLFIGAIKQLNGNLSVNENQEKEEQKEEQKEESQNEKNTDKIDKFQTKKDEENNKVNNQFQIYINQEINKTEYDKNNENAFSFRMFGLAILSLFLLYV